MSRKAWWKEYLDPFAALVTQLYERIENMPDAELAQLLKAVKEPTQTNCGWDIYHAARLMQPVANREQARRAWLKQERERAAALSGAEPTKEPNDAH